MFKMSVSPCGTFVVGSNENLPVHIWNINDGTIVGKIKFTPVQYRIPYHTFTKNNELLVEYNNIITSYIYSTETNSWICKETYTIPDNTGVITELAANVADNRFACGTNKGYVYIFNTENKQMITLTDIIIPNSDTNEITKIIFNKNILIIGSWNGNNIVYNLNTKSYIYLEKPKQRRHLTFIMTNFVLFPCLTKAIAAFNFNTYIWSTLTGKIIQKCGFNLSSYYTLSPEGTKLITCDNDEESEIKIFDL
jgi:WD40 repeat protein